MRFITQEIVPLKWRKRSVRMETHKATGRGERGPIYPPHTEEGRRPVARGGGGSTEIFPSTIEAGVGKSRPSIKTP
jgi:hypothetical protein